MISLASNITLINSVSLKSYRRPNDICPDTLAIVVAIIRLGLKACPCCRSKIDSISCTSFWIRDSCKGVPTPNLFRFVTTNLLILFLISSLEDITPITRIIVKILNCNFYRCSYVYLTLYTDIGDSIRNDYLNGSKAFIFSKLKTMSLTFLRILENWAENVAYFLRMRSVSNNHDIAEILLKVALNTINLT